MLSTILDLYPVNKTDESLVLMELAYILGDVRGCKEETGNRQAIKNIT